MRPVPTATITLLFLTACSPAPSGEGIWLLQIPWLTADGCTDELAHNFIDSYTDDEGPWTEADDIDHSDALLFAQIELVSEDSAVMVLSKTVWPGVRAGDAWVFSWLSEDTTTQSREHEEGYRFLFEEARSVETTIQVQFDEEDASGTWKTDSLLDSTWTESDEWEIEVGMAAGDIPSDEHLSYDDGKVEGLSQVNTREEQECDSAECSLQTYTTCATEQPITMLRTGYLEEGGYDQLEEVLQPFGTGALAQ